MAALKIAVAIGSYDRTQALRDGRVPVTGCEVSYFGLDAEEAMSCAMRDAEIGVNELSLQLHVGACPRPKGLHRHPGLSVSHLPPFGDLRAPRLRHRAAGGPERPGGGACRPTP